MTQETSLKDDLVRQLAQILNDTHLTEIEYEVEGCRVRVARQMTTASVAVPQHFHPAKPLPHQWWTRRPPALI